MEQENGSEEVIDLSSALKEIEHEPVVQDVQEQNLNHIPGVYRLIIKLSGGIIKTEGQAKVAAILIIILTNLFTFSMLFKDKNSGVSEEMVPTSAMEEAM